MFDASEVAQWLVATNRSEGGDVVGDAPFYSLLFDQVLDDPVQSAALLEHWGAAKAECVETFTSLSELLEAAFGPRLVLEKLQDQVSLDHTERLHNAGIEIITTDLYEIINSLNLSSSYPTPTVVPWEPGSENVIVNLAWRYSDEVPFEVLCLLGNSNTVACEVAWSEIRSRRIARRENELPANAVIIGVWLQLASSEVKGVL